MNTSKEQIVQDITKLIELKMYDEANKYIELAKRSTTDEQEILKLVKMLPQKKISMICINCDDNYIDKVLSESSYRNIEIVKSNWEEDSFEDLLTYINDTDSTYISFLEPNQYISTERNLIMSDYLECNMDADVCIAGRNITDKNKDITYNPNIDVKGLFGKNLYNGKEILELCINKNMNTYGSLSTIMLRTSAVKREMLNLNILYDVKYINSLVLNYLLIYNKKIKFIEKEIVSIEFENFDENVLKREYEEYQRYLSYLLSENLLDITEKDLKNILSPFYNELFLRESDTRKVHGLKKEITFFYTDKGEYYNLEPIEKEARERGYETKFTGDRTEQAEIGVYCQHRNYPENSKFSLVLLHDMAQGNEYWPDIWKGERWDGFDIGILPGNEWAERWNTCTMFEHVFPRKGTFMFGYPKSDYVGREDIKARAKKLKEQLGFKYDYTVLYAPSWENDYKEDDFINSISDLKVNLLIKQAHWPERFQFVIDNINEMKALHEGKYDNLYYLEPEENILVALEMCQLVISDESSVMTEAMMFGVPSISVVDWLVPETPTSKRFSCFLLEYVYHCKKAELRECVINIKEKKKLSINIEDERDKFFYNAGNCSKSIMDAVDYYINVSESNEFLKYRIKPKYMPVCLWR